MKVKALLKLLAKAPPNAEVVLAKDGEGNGFSPLADTTSGKYEAQSTYSGEFADDAEAKAQCNAVCLWPTN